MSWSIGGPDDIYESGITLQEGRLEIKIDPVRYAAQLLMEHLALIAMSKAVHTSCKLEGCDTIVFGGRGNKRFCSDEHRVKYWITAERSKHTSKIQARLPNAVFASTLCE